MIELLFADCNCQSLTKKFPLRCQKFPHSSQISSQISVGFANFVDMGDLLAIVGLECLRSGPIALPIPVSVRICTGRQLSASISARH